MGIHLVLRTCQVPKKVRRKRLVRGQFSPTRMTNTCDEQKTQVVIVALSLPIVSPGGHCMPMANKGKQKGRGSSCLDGGV